MTCRPPCTEHHGPPLGWTQAAWAVGAPPALPGGGVLAPSAASQAGPAASRTSCPRGPAHLLLRLPQADTSSSFGSVWGLRLRRPHRPAAGWCPAAASGLPGRRPGGRSADSRRGRLSGSTGAGGCAVAASIAFPRRGWTCGTRRLPQTGTISAPGSSGSVPLELVSEGYTPRPSFRARLGSERAGFSQALFLLVSGQFCT